MYVWRHTASGNASRTACSPLNLDRDHSELESGEADSAEMWIKLFTPAGEEGDMYVCMYV